MKICPKCSKEHSKDGVFCSRSCGNGRKQTPEANEKRRIALKGKPGHNKNKGRHLKPRVDNICLKCGILFQTTEKGKKDYCSKECKPVIKMGGYRPGSGRAKTGYYNGIYCGSTWELCWVIYQIDHKKDFSRFEGCLTDGTLKYFPDFIQDGKIVEIKGFEAAEKVEAKTRLANSFGYEVIVLRHDDLQKEFEWVNNNYSSDYKTLYDGYKPKYAYNCYTCKNEIFRDQKSKTEKVYCSRSCCLKGNRKVSGINQYTKHRDAAGVATSPSN